VGQLQTLSTSFHPGIPNQSPNKGIFLNSEIFSRNRFFWVNLLTFQFFSMEKAFKKQLAIWKKAVIKYRLVSSDASNEMNDLLRKIRDSGDEDLIKRVTKRYSK